MKNILIVTSVFLALALVVNTSFAKSENANGPAPKINICHKEGDTGRYHLINVSQNSKVAHIAHGDGLPGDSVSGTDDKKFGETCTLIDIDKEKEWVLVDTIRVPANSTSVTSGTYDLTYGKVYKLVASGTWVNSNNLADAEYISKDGWATTRNGYDIAPYFLGEGAFDLQVDNTFVDWGIYTGTNVYEYMYTGKGTPATFLIFDGDSNGPSPVITPGWYGDNSGSLTVNIYVQL